MTVDREVIRMEVLAEVIESFRLNDIRYNQAELMQRLGIKSYRTFKKHLDAGHIEEPAGIDGKWTEIQARRMMGMNI